MLSLRLIKRTFDFVFWYGGTSLYAIGATTDVTAVTAFNAVSLNLENWVSGNRNDTKFKELPGTSISDFNDVKTTAALSALAGEVGFSSTNVVGLEADDIFAIQLDSDRGSKYGLIKVISTTGTGPADRAITIEVKIEK